MIALEQSTWNDCFKTCVACILELDPLEDMPNGEPPMLPSGLREGEWASWLEERGLTFSYIPGEVRPSDYSVGVFWTDYELREAHAVVCHDGYIVWDPARFNKSYDEEIFSYLKFFEKG